MDNELLTETEAAQFLKVSKEWFQADRWKGPQIPFIRVGRSIRYRKEVLETYLTSRTQPAVAGGDR